MDNSQHYQHTKENIKTTNDKDFKAFICILSTPEDKNVDNFFYSHIDKNFSNTNTLKLFYYTLVFSLKSLIFSHIKVIHNLSTRIIIIKQ